jgi:hypothetical protein
VFCFFFFVDFGTVSSRFLLKDDEGEDTGEDDELDMPERKPT